MDVTDDSKRQVGRLNRYSSAFRRLGPNEDTGFGSILDAIINTLNAPAASLSSSTTGLAPSATSGTYGTPLVIKPGAPYGALMLARLAWTTSSTGSETATLSVTAAYADGSTATEVTETRTSDGTSEMSLANMISLNASGKQIVSLTIKLKSSINSSSVAVAVALLGTQYGLDADSQIVTLS
jgi:hypothetical protein